MARPHLECVRHAFEEARADSRRGDLDVRVTELALPRAAHFPAEQIGHELHPVADAEHRHADVEERDVALRRVAVRDALRTARQDDAGRLPAPQLRQRRVEGHLGVDRQLAQRRAMSWVY